MIARIGIVLALTVAVSAPAWAQTQPDAPSPPPRGAEAAAAVPASVFALRVAGRWETDGKKGFSRLVGVMESGRQRFFAQWLSAPDGAVVESKELDDAEAAKLTFGDMRAESERGGVTMFLDTEPDQDGMRDTWVVVIGEPGDVRFGPATN